VRFLHNPRQLPVMVKRTLAFPSGRHSVVRICPRIRCQAQTDDPPRFLGFLSALEVGRKIPGDRASPANFSPSMTIFSSLLFDLRPPAFTTCPAHLGGNRLLTIFFNPPLAPGFARRFSRVVVLDQGLVIAVGP